MNYAIPVPACYEPKVRRVDVPVHFMGNRRDFEATAVVTMHHDGEVSVEWVELRDARGRPVGRCDDDDELCSFALDDLSEFNEKAIEAAE